MSGGSQAENSWLSGDAFGALNHSFPGDSVDLGMHRAATFLRPCSFTLSAFVAVEPSSNFRACGKIGSGFNSTAGDCSSKH